MRQIQQAADRLTDLGIPYTVQEPLAPHTTFKIGGPAALYCEPAGEEQLVQILQILRQTGTRYYVLGKGSNILFADEGFDGVVIHIGKAFDSVRVQGKYVHAGAGAPLANVCKEAAGAGLAGLEFAYGIPGCVGGAIYMNAGAYGGEMRDVLDRVTFLDETGQKKVFCAQELELGYRTSIFERKKWCVLEASFRLQKSEEASIRAKMMDYARRRAEKQPLDMPSAGSTFKRPQGAFAGALIDECGLRGMRVGGAAISTKHCGFVVNTGGATCRDVLCLTEEVKRIVQEKTGYVLEREIRVVK